MPRSHRCVSSSAGQASDDDEDVEVMSGSGWRTTDRQRWRGADSTQSCSPTTHCSPSIIRWYVTIKSALLTWVGLVAPEALYNLGSDSWLARANDTAAHYAAIQPSASEQLHPHCSMQTYHRPNQPHLAFGESASKRKWSQCYRWTGQSRHHLCPIRGTGRLIWQAKWHAVSCIVEREVKTTPGRSLFLLFGSVIESEIVSKVSQTKRVENLCNKHLTITFLFYMPLLLRRNCCTCGHADHSDHAETTQWPRQGIMQ